jgi:uncharacterized Zn-finger protein
MAKAKKKQTSLVVKTAQNPAQNPEVIKVAKDVDQVMCDGGHPTLGHPAVYYNFDTADFVECGYCDRRFEKRG